MALLEDGNRRFVVEMEKVTTLDEPCVQMFLNILNVIKGKGGDLRFVFKNSVCVKSFAPYQNIFAIYADRVALNAGGLLSLIKQRGKILSKKTGIRLSRPVALFLIVILCGWFFSLAIIIQLQNRRLQEQQVQLQELKNWKQQTLLELTTLQERLKPLEQLGIVRQK